VLGNDRGAHPVSGTPESLARITVEDLREFHREHYAISRASFALVGDVSPRVALAAVLDAIGDAEQRPRRKGKGEIPGETMHPGLVTLDHPSGRAYVVTGALERGFSDPDRPVTEVLRLAVGWRVFEEMTERWSIAYEAGPLYLGLDRPGPFGFYVGCQPPALPRVRTSLAAILAQAREEVLPADLIADAKGAWLGAHARSYLRSDEVAVRLARNVTLGRPLDVNEGMAERIAAVTGEAARRVAARILDPEGLVTVVVGPKDVISK